MVGEQVLQHFIGGHTPPRVLLELSQRHKTFHGAGRRVTNGTNGFGDTVNCLLHAGIKRFKHDMQVVKTRSLKIPMIVAGFAGEHVLVGQNPTEGFSHRRALFCGDADRRLHGVHPAPTSPGAFDSQNKEGSSPWRTPLTRSEPTKPGIIVAEPLSQGIARQRRPHRR